MSNTESILASFDALPVSAQREVVTAILQRSSKWESLPLSDDDLVRLAAETFLELDKREAKDDYDCSR